MKTALRKLFELVYRMLPRKNHAILWGWPDHEDSVIALEQALQNTSVDKVIMLMTQPSSPAPWTPGPRTSLIAKWSPAAIFWFCSARYVFFTHPLYVRTFPTDVVSVNVWHGMPIKRIGHMLEGGSGINSNYALATSPFWADIIDRSMRPRQSTLTTGLPRNDRMFSSRDAVIKKIGISSGLKIILWLPTFRKSIRGELRTDGLESGSTFGIPKIDPATLNQWLARHSSYLVVKPHPMTDAILIDLSHLKVVDHDWLQNNQTTLYELLGATDVLISDISSVVVDYLLLDRPVIHAFPDLMEYRNSRGFSIEPVEDYFAGTAVTTQQQLLDALAIEISDADPNAAKRTSLRNLYHHHQDACATQRLLDALGLPTTHS